MIASTLTLRTFAQRFYLPASPHLSQASRSNLRYALNRWEQATHNPAVPNITAADLDAVVMSCANRSPFTARAYLIWVRILLRRAKRVGIIETVPEFPRIRCRRRLKPTPTIEDLGRMYAEADCAGLTWPRFEDPARFWRRWLVVGFFTGLRLADMIWHLRRESIRREAVVIAAQKTDKLLAVPLCPVLSRHLLQENDGADGRLFPVSNSPHLVRRELRKLSEAANTSCKVTPHAIRRASITEWMAASESAGRIVHGCGIGGVLASYVQVLRPLQRARPRLAVPPEFERGPQRQLRLF